MPLRFDGSDDKVDVAYSAALNPAQFSLSLWAKVTGGVGTYRSPITSRNDPPAQGYLLYADNANKWAFWYARSTGAWVTLLGPSVVLDAWTHIVCTQDGALVRMYIDGVNISTTSGAGFAPNTVRPLRVGAGATEGSGDFWFPGEVEDVRVYNTVLAADEVREIHAAQGLDSIMRILPYLQLRLPLRGQDNVAPSGAGSVKDFSRHARHGTPASVPVYAPGFTRLARP